MYLNKEENIGNQFSNLCTINGAPPKNFWDSVKPFLSDKGTHGNENYSLMENGQLVRDDRKIVEIINDHYINIIENLTGRKNHIQLTSILNASWKRKKD